MARLALDAILSGTGPDVEVVVSDNGDAPLELGPLPSRVVVRRPPRVLSMSENWELGLGAATGEWLMIMGDKHRLVPGTVERLLALSTGVRAVRYRLVHFEQSLADDDLADLARVHGAPGTIYDADLPFRERVLPGDHIHREWFSGVQYRRDLPMFYNSLVHRSVVDGALERFGRFFDSVSPDIWSSLVFGTRVERYRETTLPGALEHLPNSNLAKWSTGGGAVRTGRPPKGFMAEIGSNPITRDGLPPLFGGGMMFEYRQFLRKFPEYRGRLALPWRPFVEDCLREAFLTRSPAELPALVRTIARATQSEGFEAAPLVALAHQLARRLAAEARNAVRGAPVATDPRPSAIVEGFAGAYERLLRTLQPDPRAVRPGPAY
jgi:hypothetical protein